MNHDTTQQLILLAATLIFPTIASVFTAWLKKRKWIPANVREWLGKIDDADVIKAILEAGKFVNSTAAEKQEIARKYLQDKINAQLLLTEGERLIIDTKTGTQTRTNVLPSSVANYFIEKQLQELKS